jgi:copper chaperone CopZ
MTTTTYTVKGMTCSHCVNAVSTEVGGLPGVTAVDVDWRLARSR